MNPKIYPEFWTDKDLEDVGPEVRLTFLWMFSNPMVHMSGTFQLTPKRFMFETGLDAKWLEEALGELEGKFVRAGDWVWIRSFIRLQFGFGETLRRNKIAVGLARSVAQLPAAIQEAIWATYPELLKLPNKGDGIPMASPSDAHAKGMASPLQPELSPQAHTKGMASPWHPHQDSMNSGSSSPSQSHTEPSPSEGDGIPMAWGNVHVQEHKNKQGEECEEGRIRLRYDLALECLKFLGEKTGADFSRANQGTLLEPALRLHEVNYDVAGVKKMIDRQCSLWLGKARMEPYLRPGTLFDPKKFHDYYGQRDLPVGQDGEELESQRRLLEERIGVSRANRASVYFAEEHTAADREELKKWREELEALVKKMAKGK